MALHLACRFHPDVAGVFALSSFLNKDSVAFQVASYDMSAQPVSSTFEVLPLWGFSLRLFKAVEDRFCRGLPLPEVFQCHGSSDELVLPGWGEETSTLLKKAGMKALFYSFPGLSHQLCHPEMEMLRSWILQKLPPAGSS